LTTAEFAKTHQERKKEACRFASLPWQTGMGEKTTFAATKALAPL
jgi:hypothetical protein